MSDDFDVDPVSNAFFAFPPGFDVDTLMRDFLASSATVLTEEQKKELDDNSPWVEVTEEGILCSKGMVKLLKELDTTE